MEPQMLPEKSKHVIFSIDFAYNAKTTLGYNFDKNTTYIPAFRQGLELVAPPEETQSNSPPRVAPSKTKVWKQQQQYSTMAIVMFDNDESDVWQGQQQHSTWGSIATSVENGSEESDEAKNKVQTRSGGLMGGL
ncbi:hypothetical protein H6P81_016356 [Aristolochia fimbriata]|uniref:Uncharacterized protein n=1 Tax=Aristolochia fimbriata TaxID=158543 RepID=A0AAV7EAZ8_ARIFI|nr:hypothetical protein H6P81_016356 [Aristolochia fimbriata]